MSKGLEPGGLALVVNSVHPENLGKIVTLISRHLINEDGYVFVGGQAYFNESAALRPCWFIESSGLVFSDAFGKSSAKTGVALESHLMPLRDDDTDAQQEQHAPIEMEVA